MQKYLNTKSIAAGILLLALIVYGLVGARQTATSASQSADFKKAEEAAIHLKLFTKFMEKYSQQRQFEPNHAGLEQSIRNPFVVPVKASYDTRKEGKKIGRPALLLNGILWDESAASAVINNKVYTVGAKIGNYQIKNITHDKVVLVSSTDMLTLKLKINNRKL